MVFRRTSKKSLRKKLKKNSLKKSLRNKFNKFSLGKSKKKSNRRKVKKSKYKKGGGNGREFEDSNMVLGFPEVMTNLSYIYENDLEIGKLGELDNDKPNASGTYTVFDLGSTDLKVLVKVNHGEKEKTDQIKVTANVQDPNGVELNGKIITMIKEDMKKHLRDLGEVYFNKKRIDNGFFSEAIQAIASNLGRDLKVLHAQGGSAVFEPEQNGKLSNVLSSNPNEKSKVNFAKKLKKHIGGVDPENGFHDAMARFFKVVEAAQEHKPEILEDLKKARVVISGGPLGYLNETMVNKDPKWYKKLVEVSTMVNDCIDGNPPEKVPETDVGKKKGEFGKQQLYVKVLHLLQQELKGADHVNIGPTGGNPTVTIFKNGNLASYQLPRHVKEWSNDNKPIRENIVTLADIPVPENAATLIPVYKYVEHIKPEHSEHPGFLSIEDRINMREKNKIQKEIEGLRALLQQHKSNKVRSDIYRKRITEKEAELAGESLL